MSARASRRRRVAVITGTRAEYGLLCSTLDAIARHPRLDLQLVVTGMHLVRKFGRTIDDILRDRRGIAARVPMQRGDDSALDQAQGLARGVSGIAAFLQGSRSEMVVVLGDRVEAMAGALAAVATGKLLAHIHGGDVAEGDFDDSFRHAITKLAHLHLAATASARRRIIRLGEDPSRVHVVGAPGLDRLRELLSEPRASACADVNDTRAVLVLHHPIGRAAATERRTMKLILDEISRANLRPTIIYPNSDRGHAGIIDAIETHGRRQLDSVEIARSLDRDTFLRRLISARLLIGNSSSGIIEAATAGTPVVNVGPRQAGRQRSARTVLDADESSISIRNAIASALRRRPRPGIPTAYGDGHAGPLIADTLARVPRADSFRRKRITY